MIQRQNRPLGLTLLVKTIKQGNKLDDKTIYQLINYSLNHSLSLNNKPFTIETLSELLGISKAQAYKYYLQHNAKVANLITPSDTQGLYLGQIFNLLAGSSETLSQIRNQRRMLQAVQGNEYVAFLTEQVNSVMNIEMAAYEKVAKIADSLLKTTDPRGLPQAPIDTPNTEKAIGINEALRLLEANGQMGLGHTEGNIKALAISHNLVDTPQVVANLQIGNKEDAIFDKKRKDNKEHHRTRRSREYDLDEDEDDI